jgi:hypothetical protein
MDELAYGALVETAGVATLAAMAGVLIGLTAGRFARGLEWSLLVALCYLLVGPLLARWRWPAFFVLSAPPLFLTLLIGYLTTRHLSDRRRWKWYSAMGAALLAATACGAAYLWLLGKLLLTSWRTEAWIALGVDFLLFLLAIRIRFARRVETHP